MICDRGLGGEELAAKCPMFEFKSSPESLKEEFSRKLGLDGGEVQVGELARDYPDVMALRWALGITQGEVFEEDEEEVSEDG